VCFSGDFTHFSNEYIEHSVHARKSSVPRKASLQSKKTFVVDLIFFFHANGIYVSITEKKFLSTAIFAKTSRNIISGCTKLTIICVV